MSNEIEISTGQIALGTSPQVLITRGIGSCVAVGLYSQRQRAGVLLHILLPQIQHTSDHPLRFADTALPYAISQLTQIGVSSRTLIAHLTGGASMFTHLADLTAIGDRNITAVREELQRAGIPILHQEVGGHLGRNVRFDLETGDFLISYN